jgi:hypothetical protein
MSQNNVTELKRAAEAAQAAYTTEQTRLVAAGLKSQERYALLKPLKAAADAAALAYSKAAKAKIHRALSVIIEADRPAREEAARARSAWKRAKFEMAQSV